MVRRLALVLLGAGLAGTSLAQESAPATLTSLSVQLQASNPTAVSGLGSVINYFSTFNGATGPFLVDAAHANTISGELRPRAGAPGVYEGAYQEQSNSSVVDYGSYTVTVPTADADGDGVPDVFEYQFPGNFTASGTTVSASGASYALSFQFVRAANNALGVYLFTNTNAAGQTLSFSGIFAVSAYVGNATYTRGATNSLLLSLPGVVPGAALITGSTNYAVSAVDQVSYAGFTARDSLGNLYQVKPGTLTRRGRVYQGILAFADGFTTTYWADFTDYALVVTDYNDSNGNGVPDFSDLSGVPAAPVFQLQPQGCTAAAGSTVVLSARVSGATAVQWQRNGVPVAGATSPMLVLRHVTAATAGTFTCVASNLAGSTAGNAAALAVVTTTDAGRLSALSIRSQVGTGSNVMIAGLIVDTAPVKTLLQAVGPTLGALAPELASSVLADPSLELYTLANGTFARTLANDNWAGDAAITDAQNATGATVLGNPASRDSALLTVLNPGVYTANVSGNNATSGIALLQAYAVPAGENPGRLSALSIRGRVGTSSDVMIAGLILAGSTARTLLIQAVGPTLGVLSPDLASTVLPDPRLELYQLVNGSFVQILDNDDWGGDAQIATIQNSVGASVLSDPKSRDSALLVTLPPGVYTANVSGAGSTGGVVLLQAYAVP